MRVLITGGDGQLGRALHDLLIGEASVDAPDVDRLDVTDADAVGAYFAGHRPNVVYHAAAWTDVDGCERDPDRAFLVNEKGAAIVAAASAARRARLVAVSTDFVFDGRKGEPYVEADEPTPVSAYGRSKRAGERAVLEAYPEAAVVRTAWLFGEGGTGNFVTAILAAADHGRPLRVVDDQIGSPTYAVDLGAALVRLARRKGEGIFHGVNAGEASRYDFARAILDLSGRRGVAIEAIKSDDVDRPAQRPARSTLGGKRLAEAGVPSMRPWRAALEEYLVRIGERSDDDV
ncbi:MAG: dTDP-4-dehydrorhamnose reductase [Candidatus Eisenbacteria bacterium]